MEKNKKEALKLFEKEKITIGQGAKLAEMSLHQFQLLLSSEGICVHYDVEEYNEDINTINRLGL